MLSHLWIAYVMQQTIKRPLTFLLRELITCNPMTPVTLPVIGWRQSFGRFPGSVRIRRSGRGPHANSRPPPRWARLTRHSTRLRNVRSYRCRPLAVVQTLVNHGRGVNGHSSAMQIPVCHLHARRNEFMVAQKRMLAINLSNAYPLNAFARSRGHENRAMKRRAVRLDPCAGDHPWFAGAIPQLIHSARHSPMDLPS